MFGPRPEVLLNRFRTLKIDITRLKNKLNETNDEKEKWFKKKEEIKKKIQGLVKEANEIKVQKDKFNENVQLLKRQRNRYNDEVRQLIEKAKLLSSQRAKAFEKYKSRISSGKIKDKIDRIEKFIETEAVSFKKEKQLMVEINKLRAEYAQVSQLNNLVKKIKYTSFEIDKVKEKAESFHKKIQNLAKKSQDGYLEFIKKSKEINKLRKTQEHSFQLFLKFKREFSEANGSLKQKLMEAGKIEKTLEKKKLIKRKEGFKSNKEILDNKLKEVEEKIKSGKKLTTDDLLVYQNKEK